MSNGWDEKRWEVLLEQRQRQSPGADAVLRSCKLSYTPPFFPAPVPPPLRGTECKCETAPDTSATSENIGDVLPQNNELHKLPREIGNSLKHSRFLSLSLFFF